MHTMKELLKHSDAISEQTIAELCPAPYDREAVFQRTMARLSGSALPRQTRRIRYFSGLRVIGIAASLILTVGLVTGVWAKLRRIKPLPPEEPTEIAVTDTTACTEKEETNTEPSEQEAFPAASAISPSEPTALSTEAGTVPTERHDDPTGTAETDAVIDPTHTTQEPSAERQTDPSPTDPPENPTEPETSSPPTEITVTEPPTEPFPVDVTQMAGFSITQLSDRTMTVAENSDDISPDGMIAYRFDLPCGAGEEDPIFVIQSIRYDVKLLDEACARYEVYLNWSEEPYYLYQVRHHALEWELPEGASYEKAKWTYGIWMYTPSDSGMNRTLLWYDDSYCFYIACNSDEEQPLLDQLAGCFYRDWDDKRLT